MELASRKHDRFGWDRMSDEIKTLLRADWTAVLMDYTIDEIDKAITGFTLSTPNKCPNEGHILKVILANRARDVAAQPRQPEPERTREEFDSVQILRNLSVEYVPKKFTDKPERETQ